MRNEWFREFRCASRKFPYFPFSLACALAAMAWGAPARENPHTFWTLTAVAMAMAVWTGALVITRQRLALDVMARKQHYVQATAQALVFAYWGWYWPPVYAWAYFIIAQLLFAYAFDMLLAWTRRDRYTLGFGPFPVIFSINLFLWFKPDWLYLQFLMVALGFAAKEFIRWTRDGRSAHIFNPSSFPLAIVSIVLLAAGTSGATWGQEIATTQFYPPHMYLMLFLVGLPGQFFFGVTPMTMSAVVSTVAFGLIYYAVTGIYFFYDSYIPIAVFLGMHLLFTDPSTSPRTEPGRVIFGVLYGLSTVALYQLLGSAGLPTFYDKLLQVPLLNVSVKAIDWITRSRPTVLTLSRRLAYLSIWAVVFIAITAAGGVGDDHPGQWAPFWQAACTADRPYACPYLADLELNYCRQGSGWACNEAGLLHVKLSRTGEDLRRSDIAGAVEPFKRGCALGFTRACNNVSVLKTGGELESAPPELADYPIILRGSKGEIRERDPHALYALACRQGWRNVCETEK